MMASALYVEGAPCILAPCTSGGLLCTRRCQENYPRSGNVASHYKRSIPYTEKSIPSLVSCLHLVCPCVGGAGQAEAWDVVPCRSVRRAAAPRAAQAELVEDRELGEAATRRRPALLRGGRCVCWPEAVAGVSVDNVSVKPLAFLLYVRMPWMCSSCSWRQISYRTLQLVRTALRL